MRPPASSHFNGKTFFFPGMPGVKGLGAVLRWKLTARSTPWPVEGPFVPLPPPSAPTEGVAATWIGHSTFLLQTQAATILTDPIFSQRAGPYGRLGPRRHRGPGLDFDRLPRIDLVLLSHDHYDHCDLATLRRLAERDRPLVVAPLRYRSLLEPLGVTQLAELDWWDRYAGPHGVGIQLVPAVHWCRRSLGGTNRRLWGGFMVEFAGTGQRVYFAGDTAYHPTLFGEIRDRSGAPDLALLPIGAYEPRWFMRSSHVDPAEAVQIHRDLGARRSVAMHWGTFRLTDEGRDEPVAALARALAAAGVAPADFAVLPLGGTAIIRES